MRPARTSCLLLLLLAGVVLSPPARAAEPDPGALGPYAIGFESFVLEDPTREDVFNGVPQVRTLAVDVWYPVAPADHVGPPAFYSFQLLNLGFASERARTGPPAAPGRALPLVVFSHGSGGISTQSTNLCETLASHGFLVVAPNHTGNTALDAFFNRSLPFATNARNRPLDVSLLIDHMIERGRTPGDRFHRLVNPYQIGVTGHSFGGFTTLAMAAGYQDIPPDPRVRAIAPIAPASRPFEEEELMSIGVPMLILGGSLDTTTPIVPNSTLPYTLAASRRVHRVDIVGATHSHFASVCKLADVLFEFNSPVSFVEQYVPDWAETCNPDALEMATAERIQNSYVVAFFRRYLTIDTRYERYLEAPYAAQEFPIVNLFRRPESFPSWWEVWLSLLGLPHGE